MSLKNQKPVGNAIVSLSVCQSIEPIGKLYKTILDFLIHVYIPKFSLLLLGVADLYEFCTFDDSFKSLWFAILQCTAPTGHSETVISVCGKKDSLPSWCDSCDLLTSILIRQPPTFHSLAGSHTHTDAHSVAGDPGDVRGCHLN